MNVVFDGACFGDGPITGVGRAFANALAAYAADFAADCTLLLPAGSPPIAPANVRVVAAPRGAFRRQMTLPGLLRRLQADVLHSAVASLPLRALCPTIATVHDLPWLHPEIGEHTTAWRRCATRAALRCAAAVIAPSEFTAADARRLLGHGRTIHRIPHGVDLPDEHASTPRDGPFLVLGDDRPRKNRARVAAAHAEASRGRPELPALRFAGPPGHWVDEPTKRRLLSSCRAVVQCSLFEGFGMPVLEALAHGAPLLCADIPPFRELADGIAVFADPRDVTSIAAGFATLCERPPERDAEAARRRAAGFTAGETARRWRTLHRAVSER